MPAFSEISANQLMRLIGTPDAPVLIDVSVDEDFDADPFLVPGAVRHKHTDIIALLPGLTGRTVVTICQKGGKLSHGAAAMLRDAGLNAEVLAGGNYSWRDAKLPRVPAASIPPKQNGATLWVTRHRPKIDRIACPWLIRRFVDPSARFLFVPPAQVLDVAARYDATPFDIEDTFWSHRGVKCSFDTMVEEFALATPALSRLANVVRAADTNTLADVPEAAGLLALSVGLSRQYKNDTEQLDAAMPLYDALYRWARDGADETHDWPDNRGAK
ncbi:hypothetical protein ALP8811_01052 [Aliiroseovarius pelagivivens]|uniref:Rhodanese domain-containing protein n=1 Tax=Aliiroseovarius pelagivivens TaxID=1639690 RepID=A0A2R8AJ36_9RHOB|nr:sulfurtransferase/chromate resistance protein [Aliiroseovarius pelagivivens]SPF76055.1 hypothetical protein ALP8811_01052 [Aliiroseovarius pelagivivens]